MFESFYCAVLCDLLLPACSFKVYPQPPVLWHPHRILSPLEWPDETSGKIVEGKRFSKNVGKYSPNDAALRPQQRQYESRHTSKFSFDKIFSQIFETYIYYWFISACIVGTPLGRTTRRCEDNIKMGIQDVGCGGVDWIDPVQDRDIRRPVVYVVMNLLFP
jgi:hypothetical protein